MTKQVAPRSRKATLPVNYNEQLANEVANIQKRIAAPTGDRIRLNGSKSFITPDGMEGAELNVVILDFLSSNIFYDTPYSQDNPSPPACFAIGPEPAMLVPSKNSPDRQSETCSGCPNNQFGSSMNGKGKACRNTRLLAMIPAETDETEPPIWILSVPPTSLKAFDSYVNKLALSHKTLPVGVKTTITLDGNQTFASLKFAASGLVDPADLNKYLERRSEALNRLLTEPDVSQYQAPKKVVPARRAGR